MKKVYIVFWTFIRDTDDNYCQPETSIVGVYSTEELAKQKIADIVESTTEEEILSYEDYTSQCIDNGYVSSDPELDYSFTDFNAYICAEILADQVLLKQGLTEGVETEINGKMLKINVIKKG